MRKTKSIISAVLCISLILSMTACSETEDTDGQTMTATQEDFTVDLDVTAGSETEVGGGQTMATTQEDFTVDLGTTVGSETEVGEQTMATTQEDHTIDLSDINIEGAVVNYIGSYNITIAGDIKPAVKYFEENYGATIEVSTVGDIEIMDYLATLIQSGDSPDLVDQRSNSFPFYIAQNMYMNLDDYMDLSAPQWRDVASIVESYAVNGKHYYYPWAYYMSTNLLIYDRARFSSYGLADPKELFDEGQWTWNEFYDIMEEFVFKARAEFPDAIGVYGTVGSSFIDTTGVPLVGFENGQLVNNLNNANIDRAQTFLENCKNRGLSMLQLTDYGYNLVDHDPVLLGYSAFHCVGDWKITDYTKRQAKNPDLDIMFVPLPKDPNANKYYFRLNTMAYLVPSGAKDVEAACVFINCMRLSKTDASIQSVVKESIMKEKKYTDEQYEFWAILQDSSNFDNKQLVTDFVYSLDSYTNEIAYRICEDIPFAENVPTWTSLRESYADAFASAIDAINANLKN